jgi:hypothetical protein
MPLLLSASGGHRRARDALVQRTEGNIGAAARPPRAQHRFMSCAA